MKHTTSMMDDGAGQHSRNERMYSSANGKRTPDITAGDRRSVDKSRNQQAEVAAQSRESQSRQLCDATIVLFRRDGRSSRGVDSMFISRRDGSRCRSVTSVECRRGPIDCVRSMAPCALSVSNRAMLGDIGPELLPQQLF